MTQKHSVHRRYGFSLVEVLVVMGLIAMLLAVMVKVAQTVFKNAKIRATENTMKILTTAMERYRDAYPNEANPFPYSPYWWGVSPIANPGLPANIISYSNALAGAEQGSINRINKNLSNIFLHNVDQDHLYRPPMGDEYITPTTQYENYREANLSIEVLYLWLMDNADAAEVLKKIPETSLVNYDQDQAVFKGVPTQLNEIIDSWRQPLRYRYMGPGNLPQIVSAGPDGIFDSADDIVSSDF